MLIDELIFERAVLRFIFVFNGGGAFENFTHIRAGGGVKVGKKIYARAKAHRIAAGPAIKIPASISIKR